MFSWFSILVYQQNLRGKEEERKYLTIIIIIMINVHFYYKDIETTVEYKWYWDGIA